LLQHTCKTAISSISADRIEDPRIGSSRSLQLHAKRRRAFVPRGGESFICGWAKEKSSMNVSLDTSISGFAAHPATISSIKSGSHFSLFSDNTSSALKVVETLYLFRRKEHAAVWPGICSLSSCNKFLTTTVMGWPKKYSDSWDKEQLYYNSRPLEATLLQAAETP
jgi:hypothetical protein